MVNNWLNIIQDSFLPPTCILCNSPGYNRWDICYDCYSQLPWAQHQCPRCAIPLPETSPINLPCGECLHQSPAFDHTIAVFKHQHAIRYLITQLKFNAQYKHARLLGLLLAEALSEYPELPQAIIPMPLHPNRFRDRGFNQSIEIAKIVAKRLQIPLLLNHYIRQRDSPHQTHLTRAERRKNVRNSFMQVKPVPLQHIAIVDDVMTTGSTLHELAQVLKKSGIQKVDAWVCARAIWKRNG
ncbi:MAG: ComF family protein [Methylococcaceae bacterium]|nr:ComF family protein [Methylococcaceae bacterium]